MLLKWFKKKEKLIPASEIQNQVEAFYLIKSEKHKTEKLADYIQTTWAFPEEEYAFTQVKAILGKNMPLYKAGESSADFEKVRGDFQKGVFRNLPPDDLSALGRLCHYAQMVEGYTAEMKTTCKGESLFDIFESARSSRLFAYHLFQLVSRLEHELSACMKAGLHQFIYESLLESGFIKNNEQKLPLKSLSKQQKEEIAGSETMKEHLKKLSLELAEIMAHELQAGADLMQKTLNEPALQKEPIAFEAEVGLLELQKKILQLQKLSESLTLEHLKKQLLAELEL